LSNALPNISPARASGVILLLCAMALASPLVRAVPGNPTPLFWLVRGLGVLAAILGLVFPRRQGWALGAVAFLLVVVPCVMQMHYRAWSGPATYCHDSVLQFELAIGKLKAGGNPYAEDYTGTPLEGWEGFRDNPALYHFVYPPLLLLVSVPFEAAGRAVLFRMPPGVESLGARFYDQRLVVLLFFLAFLAILHRLWRDHPYRVGLIALAALNPFFAPFVVEGRNDAGMMAWVAAAVLAYRSERRWMGDLLLGLGIAAKTLLLPAVPFVAAARGREWPASAALLAAPLLLTSVPFLVADAPAYLEDLFLAPAGLGTHPFEIRGWGGYGFANLVLLLGLVASTKAWFPFGAFQLAAAAPCLYFGVRRLRREPDLSRALLWSAGTLFVVLFFGRFIHDNYIGAILSMAVISQAAPGTPPGTHSTPSSG
jgi:hypothetical protein